MPYFSPPAREDSSALSPFPPLCELGLHELYAAAEADGAGLCAFTLLLSADQPFRLWVRHQAQERELGWPHPSGLVELGIDPAQVLLVQARDVACVLQAALEGARCGGAVVVVELRGEAKTYDLTASRRLAVAAKASGARVLLARTAAAPTPSAAQTRWQVRAMPSRALAAKAPGPPAFELSLLRARNGQEGLRYCVEWDRDARQFIPRSVPAVDELRLPSLSGAVVPLSFDRSGASPDQPHRQAG
jgi:protein ImuA